MFLRTRNNRVRMEAIDGYSAKSDFTSVSKTNITIYAHTQSMGAIPLFTGVVDSSYYTRHADTQTGPDFYDIGLDILFHCIDESITDEVNVTPLGQIYTEALDKLDGTIPITGLERSILTAVTGSGIYVNILRDNGSRVGQASEKGTPRHLTMAELLERAHPDRPKHETTYEISYVNETGGKTILKGKIDDLLEEVASLNTDVSL